MEQKKVKVSERAVYARLDRALDKEGLRLRRSRSQRAQLDLGEIYVIDANLNVVNSTNIDLEDWAREYGVLADWEEMEPRE